MSKILRDIYTLQSGDQFQVEENGYVWTFVGLLLELGSFEVFAISTVVDGKIYRDYINMEDEEWQKDSSVIVEDTPKFIEAKSLNPGDRFKFKNFEQEYIVVERHSLHILVTYVGTEDLIYVDNFVEVIKID